MERPYSGTVEAQKRVSDTLSAILKRIEASIEGNRLVAASVKTCPAPCSDRTVPVTSASGKILRVRCPIAGENCAYGRRLKDDLNSYLARAMSEIGVPKRHIDSLGDYRDCVSVHAACEWPYHGFLVLCGDSCSGKSFTAVCVLRKYLKNCVSDRLDKDTWRKAAMDQSGAAWINAADITGDRDASGTAKSAYMLVLDEFGSESDTRANLSLMNRIISARYDAIQPTVITTSLAVANIKNRYGERTAERIVGGRRDGGKIIDCSNNLNKHKEEL